MRFSPSTYALALLLLWPRLAVAQREHTHTREVRAIALDGDRVWVASSGGLALHARDDGRRLRKLGAADGLPATSVHDLSLLAPGRVLLATEQGAAIVARGQAGPSVEPVAPGERDATRYDPVRAVLPEGAVLRMQSGVRSLEGRPLGELPRGMWSAMVRTRYGLALGALDGRLSVPSASGARVALDLMQPVLALAGFEDGLVVASGESLQRWDGARLQPLRWAGRAVAASALAAGEHGWLLVGTAGGQVLRLRGTQLEPVIRVQGRVTALAADGAQLWLGIEGEGLSRATLATGELRALRPEGEICSNHVTRLTRHRGLLVAGSFDGGACYLREGRWHALPLDTPYVHGVASDGRALWVAHSNGIARFDGDLSPLPIDDRDPPELVDASQRAATYAIEGPKGQVLLASPLGVLEVHRARHGYRVRSYTRRDGVPKKITALARTEQALYVASENRGVNILAKGKRPQRLRDPVQLPEAWVTALSVGEQGLWVGTCQHGVAGLSVELSQEPGRVLGALQGLPSERVIALAESEQGVWIGTLQGLVRHDGATVRPAGFALPDRRVAALFVDGSELWVGTESGLAQQPLAGITHQAVR